MKHIWPIFSILTLLPAHGVGQAMFETPLSPRIANYSINVTFDPANKMLKGRERITWHNPSAVSINELRFHLYLNAFRGSNSTYARESAGSPRGSIDSGGESGWIEIDSIKTSNGVDLRGGLEYIHPDDANTEDRTVARVPLAKPNAPRGTIVLDLVFRSKLPRVESRTGYWGDFIMAAQWFPKLGVFEVPGQRFAVSPGWNCHQFHAQTEFYADFGVYDVAIALPSTYVVGATGMLRREDNHGDGTKTVVYHAEDIHDFAWTASPRFIVLTDSWHGVALRLLIQPSHLAQGDRYLSSLKEAMKFFENHVGRYPYPMFTLVDPPYGGGGAGGMEHPTLVTLGTMQGIGEWLRVPEVVTIHEFGHNYWYGMVANNEFEEGWMDEGIDQYYEMRIMDSLYGPSTSMLSLGGIRVGDSGLDRLSYTGMKNPSIAPITTPTWQLPSEGGLSLIYFKTGAVLNTLEGLLGRPVMDSIMKVYFQRWKFRHPCARDFVEVFNELAPTLTNNRVGTDLNWFFNQTLYGTGICDYELTSLSSTEHRGADSTTTTYQTTVLVSRLGDVELPETIEVTFADGTSVREHWDGVSRYTKYTYNRPSVAVKAVVDPDQRIALDVNMLNNSRALSPPTLPLNRYWTKVLFWVQSLFQCASIF